MFYFPFYVINFYIKEKKILQALAKLRGRLVKMWRPAVVVVNKMLQRGIVDDEVLLGVTAICLVMHFWFDQYYYQCVKMGSISNMNCSHKSRSGFEFLEVC